MEKYRSSMPLFFSFAWFRNDVKRIPGAVPTESRRAETRRTRASYQTGRVFSEQTARPFHGAWRDGKENAHTAVFPCGTRRWNSGGGCVAGAYIYIYTSSEISPNCWRSSVSSFSSISSRLLITVSFSSFCTMLPPFPVAIPPAGGRQSTSRGWSPVVRL